MATAPTSIPPQIIKEDTRSTLPFVCDHPGCGKVFGDPRSVKLHWQREHYEMPQIASKARRSDQLLRAFWPESTGPLVKNCEQRRSARQAAMGVQDDGWSEVHTGERTESASFLCETLPSKAAADQSHLHHVLWRQISSSSTERTCSVASKCAENIGPAKPMYDASRVSAVTQPRQPCTFYSRMKFIDEGGESTILSRLGQFCTSCRQRFMTMKRDALQRAICS